MNYVNFILFGVFFGVNVGKTGDFYKGSKDL